MGKISYYAFNIRLYAFHFLWSQKTGCLKGKLRFSLLYLQVHFFDLLFYLYCLSLCGRPQRLSCSYVLCNELVNNFDYVTNLKTKLSSIVRYYTLHIKPQDLFSPLNFVLAIFDRSSTVSFSLKWMVYLWNSWVRRLLRGEVINLPHNPQTYRTTSNPEEISYSVYIVFEKKNPFACVI
jgi:hypothetical protein